DFQALQNAFENDHTAQIQLFLFDLPYLNGFDLRNVRLDSRREVLGEVLKKASNPLHFSKSLELSGAQLLKNACDMKLEGLIGKRPGAPYQSTRSRDWIKLKCVQRQEFVIGGYTDSKRPTPDTFGSLLLGVHADDGRLRYVGKVGTGFTETSLRRVMAKMKPLARDTMPFDEFTGEKPSRAMHWIEPKLVGEVTFSAWTTAGHIRHSSFQGLRTDKQANGVIAELPARTPQTTTAKRRAAKSSAREIIVTHGDRVIDPKTGFTKQQLVDFYQLTAPRLLPHLSDRPVSLVRAPAGIDGPLFFQKHLDTVKVAHLRELDQEFFPGHPPLIAVDTEIALLACAQMNVIEFHTWNAGLGDNQHPDRMIFDLDPGEGITWKQIQNAAQLLKAMLDKLELVSFLKTSGGKGLHVVIPLQPQYSWETVKDFSAAIVRHLAKTLPTLFVAKSGPRNRVGRIFIDYLRNGLGATTASAWSVRARPGLGVSIPVEWDELSDLTGGNHWTVSNAAERLDNRFKKVWAAYGKSGQSLDNAMTILGFDVSG
ncbi:MAG: DNA ligase D, partial [Spongiibacteraceae bacterium]